MNKLQFNSQKMTMREKKDKNLHRPGPNMGFIPFTGKGLLADKPGPVTSPLVKALRFKRVQKRIQFKRIATAKARAKDIKHQMKFMSPMKRFATELHARLAK